MDWLEAFTMPTLVVCGGEDDDNGSAAELAAALPDADFAEVPGTHMSSVTKPEFGEAIADFLSRLTTRPLPRVSRRHAKNRKVFRTRNP